MFFLSKLSLANRSIVALATIGVILFGAFVIPSIKQELLPSVTFPAISVISVYPGASPSIVEQAVTDPLEQNIQGVPGLQHITSYSNEGTSIITVQYDFGTDLDKAAQTLTQRINKTQASLPTNVTPQVQTFDISSQPIIRLAVTSSGNQQDLALRLKQDVVPVLQGLNGVANVNLTGVRNQIVTVTLDPQKLQQHGLSAGQVQSALQANNTTLPAGEVTTDGQTLAIRVGNTFNSIQDLKNFVISASAAPSAGGSQQFPGSFSGTSTGTQRPTAAASSTPVKLGDVATIEEALAPSSSLTRTDGKPSLGLAVTKTSDGNTVAISQDVKNQIPDLQKKLGGDAKITVISDEAPYIQTSVNDLSKEGLIGAGFAILVILVFLFSIRSTLVTAISIPLSIIIALIGLRAGSYSLNILTLGGLTVAVGRVIDDSIVVLENIYRHLLSGQDKLTSVLSGVREVAAAVTASTLTTVAVFLPIALTTGIVSEFFRPFAITVTVALLASLFVALTIIPVLAYWFLKAPKRVQISQQDAHEKMTLLERGYVPMIGWVTRHRILTLGAALLLLIGTFALYPRLETNFFGSMAQNTLTISQQLPPSTSMDQTNQAAQKVEAILSSTQGVKTYQLTIGSSSSLVGFSSSTGGSNTATFAVTTDPNGDQAAIQQTLTNRLKALKDVGTVTLSASQQGATSAVIAVNVQAPDEQVLRQAAQQVLDAVKQAPDTTNVSSNLADASPLIDIHVDPQKASQHGLSASLVAQSLRSVYTGTTVTQVTLNGVQQDLDLKLGTPADSVQKIQDLLLPGNVRVGDIATVSQINGPTQITHIDTTRTATINATATSQNVGAISSDIQKRINQLKLPDGVTVSLGGVTTQQQQAFQSLGLALLVAILLVYIVMVATFRSLLQPLILLVSIPFAGIGSILLLFATHTALGAPALIGLLMLIGIVVTNAIVLLDLVQQYRKKGLDARAAVIEGGRRRLRPILMTAIATILALIPMALGLSQSGGFIAVPLAIVVIGGLTSSTFLTLLLVPTLYIIVEELRGRSGKISEDGEPDSQQRVVEQPMQQQLA